VRQLEQAVVAQEGLLRAAKAERIPSLAVVSSYQRLYFPTGAITAFGVPRENMTVGLSTNFPIFTGGRIKGNEMVAQASLDETRAQLRRTREFAALDTRVALNDLAQAEAQFSASAGTAEQAQRAYDIDQVRYREGISTQTDLTQSRLLVEQAAANRALAARNLAVARVRLALLRDLPLQAGTSASAAAAAGTVTAPGTINRQPTQQQQRAAQQTAGGQANPLGGIQP
jgi:outer membrane protein TolC